MKKSIVNAAILVPLFATNVNSADVQVLDKTINPASNFLAYTEFELSGEPLAEALGLDLDTLDPYFANTPTDFDFAAGIESYEYSEEAMYALNYQSSMGLHLVNGPLNQQRQGGHASLNARIKQMASAVGLDLNEVPVNMYPLSLPYSSGIPEFAQRPNSKLAEMETAAIITAKGNDLEITYGAPAYMSDYETLRWDSNTFDKSLNPAAIGGIFLKEVMWSQDFLGGMHVTTTDEEVEATSMIMDRDGRHSLGVSAADGFNGVLLTEMSIDKLILLQQQLGFDGKTLGAKFDLDYDPTKQPIWFAHKVAVKEQQVKGVNAIASLGVADGKSTLRDTWQLLWPVAEFYAFSDQRVQNKAQNPASLAVFDGQPFAAAPAVNTDAISDNDIPANDAFSLANNISHLLIKNLEALHFNSQFGTLVTDYKHGKKSKMVNTYDASYSLVALAIYQRAKDALPVGYGAAEAGSQGLQTPEGQHALKLLKAQADFIVDHLVTAQGLVTDEAQLTTTVNQSKYASLESQFAAIRGLVSAFVATKEVKYKQAARSIYLAVEQQMYDPAIETWSTKPGSATIHTPYTAAAISGGLREVILHLKNEEGESNPSLELQRLTERYVSWFKTVINGGMQLAELIGDTGELVRQGSSSTDTDEDGVQQIIAAGGKYGTAPTMANKVRIK